MREWRNHRGLSLGKLSKKILFNPSYMARAERGDQAASADLVTAYDHALGADGSLVRSYRRNREEGSGDESSRGHVSKPAPDVAKGHVALEDTSGQQGPSSEGAAVPVRTDDGRIIFVPLSRRTLLSVLGSAAALSATPEVASATPAQLPSRNPIEHLKATQKVLIDNDNLFGPQQVIPVVQRQIAAIKALRKEGRGSDRLQLLRLQTQFSEFCGWLYQDLRDFRAAQHWMREALETSHLAADPDLTTFILARRSQLAGDMGDSIEAVDVAEAAREMAAPQSRLAAVAATYGAHGHALRGETLETQRAYERAHDLRESMDPDPESPWGIWLDTAYIEVHRAYSLASLGQHQAAASGFRQAIAELPPGFHRDRGVYLAREAVAHAESGEPEQATNVGLEALDVAKETGSARITRELARLDNRLSEWSTVPSVTEFKEAMDTSLLREA